jgi:hypothetical protein
MEAKNLAAKSCIGTFGYHSLDDNQFAVQNSTMPFGSWFIVRDIRHGEAKSYKKKNTS